MKIKNKKLHPSETQSGKGFQHYSSEIRFGQGFERNIAKICD